MAEVDAASKEEQARRARALAEKCFLAGNVYGARQWMQSALRLAPGLPGTAQIVAAYDVHAAAARRPPDWYAVLGLRPPGVTHDDVKRHHRRLCLLVHPDKNPSAAADGAFKLVQAAWQTLSVRHPPGAPAPPPRPQPPPQQRQPPTRAPEPQPRQRPQVVQMQRRAPAPPPRPAAPTRPSYAQQASAPKPPEKGPPMPTASRSSASPDKCPACGASTPNGKSSFRCGSCHWSPMDGRPDDDDDDFFEDDYYF
nr:unnamed protein product [Digitaria exilis]